MLTIEKLLAKIKLSNNGYISYPTAAELQLAHQNPGVVKIENGLISKVSIKIEYLKTSAKQVTSKVLVNDFDYEGAILARQESKMIDF